MERNLEFGLVFPDIALLVFFLSLFSNEMTNIERYCSDILYNFIGHLENEIK